MLVLLLLVVFLVVVVRPPPPPPDPLLFFFVGRLARDLVCTPWRRMVRYRRSDGSWRDSLGTTRRSFKKLAMYVAMHHVRRRERPVSIPKFKYMNGSKKQVKNNCVEHLERT